MNNTFNIGAMDTVYPFIPMYPNGQPPVSYTHLSEAQIMPLSKVLEWMMELTASTTSAVSSM